MTATPHVERANDSARGSTPPTLTWELVHAEPGALVYAVPRGELPAHPLLRRTAGAAGGWTPSGSPDGDGEPRPGGFEHPVLHHAGYIGRVGLLAAALGAGAAVAGSPGTAWADPAAAGSTSSSSESATARAGSAPQAGPSVGTPGSTSTAQTPSATTRRDATPPPLVRSSGGAHTSTAGGATDPTPAAAGTADAHPDTMSYAVSGGPSKGTVTLNPTTGAFAYTPVQTSSPAAAPDVPANQLDGTFNVTVNDGRGGTATVPVSLATDPANAAPTATLVLSDSANASTVHVSVNSDPVTYLVVHDPAYGSPRPCLRDRDANPQRATPTPPARPPWPPPRSALPPWPPPRSARPRRPQPR